VPGSNTLPQATAPLWAIWWSLGLGTPSGAIRCKSQLAVVEHLSDRIGQGPVYWVVRVVGQDSDGIGENLELVFEPAQSQGLVDRVRHVGQTLDLLWCEALTHFVLPSHGGAVSVSVKKNDSCEADIEDARLSVR
jgi:hypothetical protein